ncbi:MAG: RDD family protein [Terriglobales bacterium]
MNATFFCNKCGAPNDAGAQFCSRCGAALNAVAAPSPTPGAAAAPAPGYAAPPVGYPAPAPYPPYAVRVHYGGFWIRVVATIIDAVIVRAVLFPLKAAFGLGGLAAGGFDGYGLHRGFALPYLIFGGGILFVLTLGASWLYEAFMESSSYQATLGKMIFGMKVTDLYGNRISFARATGRHFAKIVSGLLLCIGFIMVGLTERKQGLHDMMAGTLVPKS